MKMVTLNEMNEIKRTLIGDYKHKIKTFAILTTDNLMLSLDENNERTAALQSMLKKIGCQYIPINGFFDIDGSRVSNRNNEDNNHSKETNKRRPEKSLLLINVTLNETMYLATRFEQLSFFFGEIYWSYSPNNKVDIDVESPSQERHTASSISYYERMDTNSNYKLIETSKQIDNAADFDNFFSKYKDLDYSIYMKIFNEEYENILDVVDYDCLYESLDETKADKYRATRRRYAYNGKLL